MHGRVHGQVQRLFALVTAPFDEHPDLAAAGYSGKRPESEADFVLSCSS